MDFRAVGHEAFKAVRRNKLRAALTMLGITIGIGAVICTVAIGEGGSRQIQAQLDSLGDNMIWVEAGARQVNGVRSGTRGTKSLTEDDAKAIIGEISLLRLMSPNVDGPVQVAYGNLNWATIFRGVAPEFLEIRRWPTASGGSFTKKDVESHLNVCLLGQTVVTQLFGDENPIGKTIRVGGLPCPVMAVLAPKGLSPYGRDQDDFVMMPYTTAMRKISGQDWLDDIFLSAISPDVIRPAQAEISRLLRQRHHLRPDEDDDFNIRSPEDVLKAQEETSRTFTLMLASIASVSLLVGGIGIMNIMLVSVTERTREIGVRMAVGATEEEIQLQFLSEAVALSLFGGALGVLAGILSSKGLSALLEWPTEISTLAVVIAAFFSVAVGVFFGYYPAKKAARLDPIEALRYE